MSSQKELTPKQKDAIEKVRLSGSLHISQRSVSAVEECGGGRGAVGGER